jgi:hypothetical protein
MILAIAAVEETYTSIAEVNEIGCCAIAHLVPSLAESRKTADPFSLSSKSVRDQTKALIHLVGICHRLNWDFTLGGLAAKLWDLTDGFDYPALSRLGDSEFRKAFSGYSRNDGGLNYKGRLSYLRKISEYISSDGHLDSLLSCRTVAGTEGALAKLSCFPVYKDDPLKKKCNALLHELVRRRLVSLEDPDRIEPAVDYHIIRLYLRTGRVLVKDCELHSRLVERKPVRIEAITQIRRVVADAMRYTAAVSSTTVSVLNDIEWAYARQACRRDDTWCAGPCNTCLLESACMSAHLDAKQMITEPESHHGHY